MVHATVLQSRPNYSILLGTRKLRVKVAIKAASTGGSGSRIGRKVKQEISIILVGKAESEPSVGALVHM